MKKLLSLVLCLALLASLTLASVAVAEVSPVVAEKAMAYLANYDGAKYTIKAPDFFAKIDAGEEMLILDIRQPDAYAESHVAGAINVPFGKTIAEKLANIPDDVQLYVYCYTGQTASQTTALLNVAGKFATNVQGGFNNGISEKPLHQHTRGCQYCTGYRTQQDPWQPQLQEHTLINILRPVS